MGADERRYQFCAPPVRRSSHLRSSFLICVHLRYSFRARIGLNRAPQSAQWSDGGGRGEERGGGRPRRAGMDPNQTTQITQLLIRRRRSAILAADVAGYSKLMG